MYRKCTENVCSRHNIILERRQQECIVTTSTYIIKYKIGVIIQTICKENEEISEVCVYWKGFSHACVRLLKFSYNFLCIEETTCVRILLFASFPVLI